jgi:hypothetical protein
LAKTDHHCGPAQTSGIFDKPQGILAKANKAIPIVILYPPNIWILIFTVPFNI